jgi:hypothetical protein
MSLGGKPEEVFLDDGVASRSARGVATRQAEAVDLRSDSTSGSIAPAIHLPPDVARRRCYRPHRTHRINSYQPYGGIVALRNEFERSGVWLFRWRGYLPLVLFIPVLAACRTRRPRQPARETT